MKTLEESIRGNRYFSWFLRGFLLLITFLYLLFSFDVFSVDASIWHKIQGFLAHNIYSLIMIMVLYIAWEREDLAGYLLIGMSISMVFFFGGPSAIHGGSWIMISLPIVNGFLFLCNYFLIKQKS